MNDRNSQITAVRPGLVIRQAALADLPLIERDLKPAVGRTFQQELDEQDRDEHSLFITVDAGELLGWGFIRWLGPRDAEALRLFPKAPEIYRLEVRAPFRSTGLGRLLIGAMESEAVREGFREVSLGVGHENPRAYALYQTLGYQDTALTEYFDEYEYPLEDGGFGLARDICRYLVKVL
jgi:ribosomal protein S18 acetylase RimI-like enzyme